MRVSFLERAFEFGSATAAEDALHPANGVRHRDIVGLDMIVGAKVMAVLRLLERRDRAHASIVEDDDHAANAMGDRIDQDLRVHHERAVAAKRDHGAGRVGGRGRQ